MHVGVSKAQLLLLFYGSAFRPLSHPRFILAAAIITALRRGKQMESVQHFNRQSRALPDAIREGATDPGLWSRMLGAKIVVERRLNRNMAFFSLGLEVYL
jgi:hypothetical protein